MTRERVSKKNLETPMFYLTFKDGAEKQKLVQFYHFVHVHCKPRRFYFLFRRLCLLSVILPSVLYIGNADMGYFEKARKQSLVGCSRYAVTSTDYLPKLLFTLGKDGSRIHCGKVCGGSAMLRTMFCLETLGPGIHVDIILTVPPT